MCSSRLLKTSILDHDLAKHHEAWSAEPVVEVRKRSVEIGHDIAKLKQLSGKSTYSEFLDRVPEGGIHHLGYAVDDYDAATKDLEARGYKLVQRGTFGDTKFGYYESDDDFGTLTEIIYLDANVQGMFANIKAQTF